jgi:3'(2'), 5'-bisphosphate nucleotidase
LRDTVQRAAPNLPPLQHSIALTFKGELAGSMGIFDHKRLTSALYPAVLEAGRVEMQHFPSGPKSGLAIETKIDKSPVTAADREAEAIIVAALTQIAPGVPIVAEEAVAAGHIPERADRFFLVDALDGTRLFIRGKPEFSVNIGLVENGRSVFGLIYIPPTGALFVTVGDGSSETATAPCALTNITEYSALKFSKLAARMPDPANLKAYNSASSGGASSAFLAALNVKEATPVGSSLKFCLIAAGHGDLYARFGETSEWDTAAGQAILEAAGGSVTTLDGAPLSYGKASTTYRNPHFVAWGLKALQPGTKA